MELSSVHDPKRPALFWGFRGILTLAVACLPVAISSMYSYKSAALESDAAKIRAEAGYSTMSRYIDDLQMDVRDLQSLTDQQGKDMAEMRGFIQAMGFKSLQPAATPGNAAALDTDIAPVLEGDEKLMEKAAKIKAHRPKSFKPVPKLDAAVEAYQQAKK
jgi:hypothetical protein